MTGKDGAGHMLLIRDAMPEVYSRTYKFLNVLDYMNLRLCGEFVATFDSIVTSWVTDNRDAKIVRYDDSLIAMLGIDRAKFPDIVPCSTVIGELKADVAAALGLAPGVKVVAGSIDNTASAVGSGAVEDYQVHLYIGTSSWLAAHVPFKKTDLFSSIASIPCALPERYLLTAQQSNAGGNLNFLRDNILYHKDELLQEEKLPDVFKIMDRIAESTPAGSNGVLYTPWIWGERAPVDDKHLRAGLYNIGLHNTRADIIRAFLEGVALNTRWMLGPVEKFLERKATLINLTGGGASSDIWCQIFADVMNVTVRQVKDAIQSNARGAAWIASAGLGEISFTDVPNLIEYKRVYTPTPAHRQVYDERFAAFVSVHRQMRGVYKRMNP
jgi:xylulokinase